MFNLLDDKYAPPVLITGMHRSGTTLIAKLLSRCGYFCGKDLDSNCESEFFLNINEWLLRQANGAWDSPESFRFVTSVSEMRSQAIRRLRRLLKSPWLLHYFGLRNFLSKRSALSAAWGFKDPRLVYTMSLWNEVFSGRIRLIYVQRNGVDVARSLQARQQKVIDGNSILSYKRAPLIKRIGNTLYPVDKYMLQSPRCYSLDEAFSLWEMYILEGEAMYHNFTGDKIRIVYEDFVVGAVRALRHAALFCGLQVEDHRLVDAVRIINKQRSYAFLADEQLRSYYKSKKNSEAMEITGYANINPK